MAASVLNAPHFQCEDAAFAYVESRLWPNGPVCHHCDNADPKRLRRMAGKTTRKGLIKCYACGKPFTVRMGTIFESSHLPLHLWLQVIHLMCASKKGISTRQIQRMLSCSMKTAWQLTHRIREAMRSGELSPLGGAGKTVEIDETIIGKVEGAPKDASFKGSNFRNIVLTLVERGGAARSWHVDGCTMGTLMPIIRANIAKETAVITDEASWYRNLKVNVSVASHDAVNHAVKEYARYEGERVISTNTVEGFYGVFKRGMKGVYQHCGERHLHRYLAEFDFRYSNRAKLGIDDKAAADLALLGVVGKRLTYQTARN
ncbi:IS1595 family transposase [Methylocystis bryophila]|uniref:IS1595 family transposase n=1 Tax=Methylocystis bryophila TaxID=655015 RepID=A0A1W6MWS4_9HYPH|nr:IS1595 family transposase [Methylocystis bryophila]ARN82034.1 IS1595 family transposase [Methylocystis bryophila]BDV38156.1 DDE transposase [Methylocystis bryophila]